jgi:predicted AAA+ superfamily ATPase
MLSSEISTYLTGRYVSFEILPLSIAEVMQFTGETDLYAAYKHYCNIGGFPIIHADGLSRDTALTVVKDICNAIVFGDIVKRNQIRNTEMLERIIKFVFENIGSVFSANSISSYLKSQHRKIDVETVYNYLEKLESSFIIYRCNRYDIKGKEVMKTQEKFFLSDIAFRYSILGFDETASSGLLENIVYLELRRRGYTVYVGKMSLFENGKQKTVEVDFVGEKQGEKIYIQVADRIDSITTEEREYTHLLEIPDNYPKYVLTLNNLSKGDYEGIKSMHIADWLLGEQYRQI